MTGNFRFAVGGRVDRQRPLSFTFDGRRLTGYAGDTLASALLANGIHLVGRSFKYHRPRGIIGACVEEPNALVEIDRGQGRIEPNLQATMIELYGGLVARSQNRWPTLRFDLGAVNNFISAFIPAGFYYKTFMWPRGAWKRLYEPGIRRMAGLGRPPVDADPDRYAFQYAHCDVLVVGAGPAGLAAALAASEGSERVILCDEAAEFGGTLLADPDAVIDGLGAGEWVADAVAKLRARPNVILLPRTTAFRYDTHNMVGLAEKVSDHCAGAEPGGLRQRWHQVRAARVVLATGAHERPILFRNNDRPGIMLASAARTYVNRYAVRLGQHAIILTRTDSGYAAAFDLAREGISTVILDLRPSIPAALSADADSRGIEVVVGVRPLSAGGSTRVRSLKVALPNGATRSFRCDLILMAGGWAPVVHLFSQSRGTLRWDDASESYLPENARQRVRCVGACNGDFSLAAALTGGTLAGADAPARGERTASLDMRSVPMETAEQSAMAFVDFQNDVTSRDVRLAVQEGFVSVEHFKRYTTTGMATDQGRTSNLNAMAVAGDAIGVPMGQVGITTFRAPYTPTSFGLLTGYNRGDTFAPARHTPTHDWATERGAVFEDVGLWKRARYFPRRGESMEDAVRRECRTTREAAGIMDASTLGKIEVVGPDAATFMDRMYINAWSRLKVGSCRYGVLLHEDGYVFDDGVVGRIAEDRFHVTTTSSGAAGVFNLMEDYLQTEWPDLDVWLTSTTEQWAVIAVQGPRARDLLAPLIDGIDLSPDAFPHMTVREGRIAGVPTRLFRMSFTGELGFEVNVPSAHGLEIWETIWAEGQKHGATAYGTETTHVLRAEKGFIIVGQETDGTVTPDDVGLSWAIGKTKGDFVGKRSLSRPDLAAPGRKQLVGLRPVGHMVVPDEGAQLIADGPAGPSASQGYITSAYWSEALDGPIAMALLQNGRARGGDTVRATSISGSPTLWRVVDPVFYDPEGTRLHA
jgi:sarcosine oxidase subunit alpha